MGNNTTPIIEACPFCEKDDQVKSLILDAPLLYTLTCQRCLFHGPWKPTEQEAVEAWNRPAKRIRTLKAAVVEAHGLLTAMHDYLPYDQEYIARQRGKLAGLDEWLETWEAMALAAEDE